MSWKPALLVVLITGVLPRARRGFPVGAFVIGLAAFCVWGYDSGRVHLDAEPDQAPSACIEYVRQRALVTEMDALLLASVGSELDRLVAEIRTRPAASTRVLSALEAATYLERDDVTLVCADHGERLGALAVEKVVQYCAATRFQVPNGWREAARVLREVAVRDDQVVRRAFNVAANCMAVLTATRHEPHELGPDVRRLVHAASRFRTWPEAVVERYGAAVLEAAVTLNHERDERWTLAAEMLSGMDVGEDETRALLSRLRAGEVMLSQGDWERMWGAAAMGFGPKTDPKLALRLRAYIVNHDSTPQVRAAAIHALLRLAGRACLEELMQLYDAGLPAAAREQVLQAILVRLRLDPQQEHSVGLFRERAQEIRL